MSVKSYVRELYGLRCLHWNKYMRMIYVSLTLVGECVSVCAGTEWGEIWQYGRRVGIMSSDLRELKRF